MDEVVEALEKYHGLVPLVYDIEIMGLDEARPEDMQTAVYLKREADKVIADLEESHKMEVEQLLIEIAEMKKACNSKDEWCLHTLKENRRHKYKRCLAMAKYCHESAMWLEECGSTKSATFMFRWEKRWLELAEKFNNKEAK